MRNFLFITTLLSIISLGARGQETQNKTVIIDSVRAGYHIRSQDLDNYANTNELGKEAVQTLGGSVTGILKRSSGISFAKGTLVSVRGLSPRYTGITIDGLNAPVTEQNIKAFALGLLPASSLQGLAVYKSGYYTNQSEWGGASLDISTNANVEKEFTKFTFTLGYQYNFTFDNFIQDVEYGTKSGDLFGYSVDSRDWTNDISSAEVIQQMSRSEAAEEGKKLTNNYGLEVTEAMPNNAFGFSFGRILHENGDQKFSTINSLNYARIQKGSHWNRAKYTGYEYDEQGSVISSELSSYSTDGIYSTITDVMLNSSWNYAFNDDHSINLDVMYTHSTDNATISRYFVGLKNQVEAFAAQYGIEAKQIFLTRLSGKHEIGIDTDIDWAFGYTESGRKEPDLRRAGAQRNLGELDTPYLMIIPESSKADNGARFSSDLSDETINARIDGDHDFIDDILELKFGFIAEESERDFGARIITSAKDDFTSPDLRFVLGSELETVFEPENYGPEGYYIVDGTTAFDRYRGESKLLGGYLGLDWVFTPELRASLGLRGEKFEQTLVSGEVNVKNDQTDYLPYFNFNYLPNGHTIVKLGYSMSLNRPAFRELSPFAFYDFDYRADIQGNPELENATLQNLDLSVLFTFGKNEYFSMGTFYKKIDNPIEMVYVIRSELALFSFNNAEKANLIGVELEFGKFLSSQKGAFLNHFMLNGNVAYTYSRISLGEDTNEVASDRPLQGQTPFILNTGLTFLSNNRATQVTVSYDYIGKSLFSVGDGQETFPWYNMPRQMLNASFGYRFSSGIGLTLGAFNLLNAPFEQVQDNALSGDLDDPVNKTVNKGYAYQNYNLTLSYNF